MTERIRIVHVLEATAGGTSRHLVDIVEQTDLTAFDLNCVVSLLHNPDFTEEIAAIEARGVTVTVLPMTRWPHPIYEPWVCLRLRQIIKATRCEILHLHSARAGWFGRIAALGLPCRIIYAPHAFAFLRRDPLRWLYRLAEWMLARRVQVLHAVSEAEAEVARATGFYGHAVIRVVRNAIDLDRCRPFRLAEGSTSVRFGFVADLRPQKAPFVFLDAARDLVRRGHPLRCALPAHGPLLGAVRTYIRQHGLESHFEFCDTETSMRALYDRTDIAVLTSVWEGLPYTLLEVMSLGKPILVSDLPVFKEVVGCIEPGLVFPLDDSRELANRMEELMRTRPERLASMGRQLQQRVQADFDIHHWRRQLEDMYRALASAGSAHMEADDASRLANGEVAASRSGLDLRNGRT